MIRTSMLGGETKSRGLLSGRRSRGVMVAWIAGAAVFGVLVLFLQLVGLVIAVPLAAVLLIFNLDTGTGTTPLRRVQDRRRMAYRRRHGFHDFVPIDWRPPSLTPDELKFSSIVLYGHADLGLRI